MIDASVTEDELHAYTDGALPADRIAAVEAHLAANPGEAARVAAWRAQGAAIRARWGGVADEPVPDRLRLANLMPRTRGLLRRMALAASVALLVGAAAGWSARGYLAAGNGSEIVRDPAVQAAVEAHRLYINEVRHPIEVRADEAHLLTWLSRRVGSPVQAPDLIDEGFKLLGGRLLPGPIALIMYEGATGERVTVSCARAKEKRESAFKWRVAGEVGALAWSEAGLSFVVAGPPERARLDRIARRIHAAYEAPAGR